MVAARNYSSTATQVTITGALTNVATSMVVSSGTGFPLPPFAGVIDLGRVTEEAVLVTAVVGTTFTITRGYDSTAAVAHDAGATFDHAALGIDLREAGVHVGNNAAVHGVTGSVVGTTDVQTLTNKTLTSPTITGGTQSAPAITGGTVSGATVSGGTLSGTIAGTPTLSGVVTFSAAPTFSAGAALGTATTLSGTPTFSGAVAFTSAVTFNGGGALGTGTYSGAATFSGNVTFSGSPTFSSTSTFTGAATFNGGGALSGTFSGSPTFSGNPSFTGTPSFTNSPTSPANGPFAAWQSYTVSWTGTTNPAIGNGSITGAYVLIGKICFFRIFVTMGSTTTYGTGPWSFSLPFTPNASASEQLVTGYALDSAPTTAVYRGIGRISSGSATIARSHFVDGNTTTSGLTSAVPFTWASGDQISFSGFYEIA